MYVVATAVLLNPSKLTFPKPPAAHGEVSAEEYTALKNTPWDFNIPDMDRLIKELHEEKERLNRRSKELDDLYARIQTERAELTTVTQQVFQLQAEFNQVVTYVKEQEAANQKKLAKTYAAMAPEDAALIMKQMDDDRIVRMLMFMNEEETAKILSVLAKPGPEDARRAAMLSERLRLSVKAPAGGNQSKAAPGRGPVESPLQQLVRINQVNDAASPADFQKMARTYAALPPQQAVNILKQLQDEQMAGILAHFTEEETAPILVELSKPDHGGPQRAAHVAELLLKQLNLSTS